jgi:DNA/RNA-binding domain of Phe-tRNA-synthetase-like protein
MPNTEIKITEIFEVVDGVSTLIDTIQQEVEVPTQEEIIAEKEAELLAMYKELQELKNNI